MQAQAFQEWFAPLSILIAGLMLVGALVAAARAVQAKRLYGYSDGMGLAIGMVIVAISLPLLVHFLIGDSTSTGDSAGPNPASTSTSTSTAVRPPAVQNPSVELAVPSTTTPAVSGGSDSDVLGILWTAAAVVVIVLCLAALFFGAWQLRRRHAAAAAVTAAARQHWNKTVADHNALSQELVQIETDVMARVTMPTFWDYSVPASSAWWTAEAAARDARTETMPDGPWREKYRTAVTHAQVTFRDAVAAARRTGLSLMSPEDRRKVETARRALAIVLDDAAPEAERRTALRVAVDNLAGLVDLPPQMRAELSSSTRHQLSPGPDRCGPKVVT